VRYPGRPSAGGPLFVEQIRACEMCGMGTATPRPDQERVDRFYASGGYWHGVDKVYGPAHERSQSRLRVKTVSRYLKGVAVPLRVAELGAGYGGIPVALARFGLPVVSYVFVEPDEAAAAAVLRARLPFRVDRVGSAPALPPANDLLFINHVLEHVAEPKDFLREVVARVASGGLVYVETPHADHLYKDDVFPHLSFFTQASLLRLGEQISVDTLLCESFGRLPAPKWTPVGIVQRIAARAFRVGARAGWNAASIACDRIVWRYGAVRGGIWLRWIFRAGARAQTKALDGTNAC
jgi:SAM-dependent methyltransferase